MRRELVDDGRPRRAGVQRPAARSPASARARRRRMPRRLDHLGLLADDLGEALRGHRRRRRLDGRALGQHLVGEGDGDEDERRRRPRTSRGSGWKLKIAKTKSGVHGRSKSAKSTGEADEPLHRLEVAQPRPRLAALAGDAGRGRGRLEDLGVEAGLDQRADAGGDAAAGVVEHAHDAVERGDQHGEGDQRRLRPARQHPVVDLEHVERAGQHQDVDEAAEDRQRHEQRPRAAQGLVGGRGGVSVTVFKLSLPWPGHSRERLPYRIIPLEGWKIQRAPCRCR